MPHPFLGHVAIVASSNPLVNYSFQFPHPNLNASEGLKDLNTSEFLNLCGNFCLEVSVGCSLYCLQVSVEMEESPFNVLLHHLTINEYSGHCKACGQS